MERVQSASDAGAFWRRHEAVSYTHLAYIIVRDLQTGSRIEKLIAENKAIAEKAGEEKKT